MTTYQILQTATTEFQAAQDGRTVKGIEKRVRNSLMKAGVSEKEAYRIAYELKITHRQN
jgi:hypothetical protein